ncbi:glycosyltransferase (plasmid) [Salipiger sp. H15]|uniref:Glycosyltransferase n=1 Tax=Alloyangia sp. H15 TaxID=3029062 RepID=A0AAU8AT46_9RHOB
MRILHVIADIDPAHGGPQSGVIRLAAAQAAQGAEVVVASYSPAEVATAAAADVPNASRVAFAALRPESGSGRFTASAAAADLRPLIGEADFLHLHGVWEPVLLRAARLANRANVAHCITLHGMLDPWSLSQKRLKKVIALRLGFRRMLNRTDFIHTLNDDERSLIAPLGLTADTCTIPNGISLAEVDGLAIRGGFRARFPALGDAPYILFLSRLHPKKGLDILAQAFALLLARRGDVHLVVAGPDAGAEAELRAAIDRTGIGASTHITGPLYGAAKFEALADAACFCLPSRQEGFSIAITEALASATPVVISDQCHFPEVAAIGAGHVVPLSPDAVCDGLDELLSDPERAAEMGRNGRRLVEERLTWDSIARQTLRAYGSYLRRPGSAPTAVLSARRRYRRR